MPNVTCQNCAKEFEDELLCCPHCGEAQIPQLSKAQLRLEQMKASQGPLAAIYTGLALGLLAGGIFFVITVLNDTASLGTALAALMSGMVGSAAGLLFHRFVQDRRTRRQRRKS
jgi:hypothetical protein